MQKIHERLSEKALRDKLFISSYSIVPTGPPQGPVQNLSFIEQVMIWKRYWKCKGSHEIRTISIA